MANFHVLRETTMPAFLSENGFIDHPVDAALMKKNTWKQCVAEGHVNGLAKAFNLRRRGNDIGIDTGSLYKIIASSFQL